MLSWLLMLETQLSGFNFRIRLCGTTGLKSVWQAWSHGFSPCFLRKESEELSDL